VSGTDHALAVLAGFAGGVLVAVAARALEHAATNRAARGGNR
jgi:hypothetical protein